MSANRLRALVFGLLVLAAVLALIGTLAESAVAGWLGVAALGAVLAVYVLWRRTVRRTRY
jgi:Na+/proline symporter